MEEIEVEMMSADGESRNSQEVGEKDLEKEEKRRRKKGDGEGDLKKLKEKAPRLVVFPVQVACFEFPSNIFTKFLASHFRST